MRITLQYIDDCPNWETTAAQLSEIVGQHRLQAIIDHQLIDSPEMAAEHRFRGSPTVLINGVDPFADTTLTVGLSCRIYSTASGPAGSPTIGQLSDAITASATKE